MSNEKDKDVVVTTQSIDDAMTGLERTFAERFAATDRNLKEIFAATDLRLEGLSIGGTIAPIADAVPSHFQARVRRGTERELLKRCAACGHFAFHHWNNFPETAGCDSRTGFTINPRECTVTEMRCTCRRWVEPVAAVVEEKEGHSTDHHWTRICPFCWWERLCAWWKRRQASRALPTAEVVGELPSKSDSPA